MLFREPTKREKDFYLQCIDRVSASFQSIIVLFLVSLTGLCWYAINDLVSKIIVTLIIGIIAKKPFQNSIEMVIQNKYYKEGNYQVAEITIDPKNFSYITMGGSTYNRLLTYKVAESHMDVMIDRKSKQKIQHDKKAILIKMKLLNKTTYYITECI